MLTPRSDRVGLVETDSLSDGLPEPLDVGLAEDRRGPALVWVGDDRPVAEAVGQLERRLRDLAHPRLADALAVEIREELWLRVARDRAERAADLAELLEPPDEPGRRVAELVVGGLLDVRAAHMLVRVEDVHVAGAGRVGLARDRPHKGRMLDQCIDPERLAGLEVQPDLNGEPCVLLEALVRS